MKILVLTPLTPLKQEGGLQKRVYNIWKRLALEHEVTLLSVDSDKLEEAGDLGMKLIRYPQAGNFVINLMKCAWSGLIPTYHKHSPKKLISYCQKIIEEQNIDLVIADHYWVSPTALKLKGPQKILLSHGFEYVIHERWQEKSNPFKALVLKFLSRNMKKQELEIMKQFDKMTCVGKEEQEELSDLGIDSEIIPNGTNIPELKEKNIAKNNLLFMGSLDYLPNNDGLEFFLKEIYPLVKKEVPEVKFNILGRMAPDWLEEEAKKDETINLHGFVPSVEPFIDSAEICLAPLRMGSGSRLKILEYFAQAKPVIATTIAAEGIDYEDDKNVLITDEPKDFAEKIISLLNDSNKQDQLGLEARRLVVEKYSWDSIAQKLGNFIS